MRAETTSGRTSTLWGGRRAWNNPRRAILLGLVPAAVIAAACGSSSTTSSTTTTKGTTASSAAPAAAPTIKTATNAKFGTILVDGQGRTLYTLTNNGKAVACTSTACTAIWPPLLLPSGQNSVTAGPGVSNVATVSANGGQQVTFNGTPLYRFSGDASAGSANGDGINSFGGIWHVVKVGGGTSGATGGGTATTGGSSSTTSGGSSGGY
jgi:predicted lipoprotein with Yx(FWY)xxD motif